MPVNNKFDEMGFPGKHLASKAGGSQRSLIVCFGLIFLVIVSLKHLTQQTNVIRTLFQGDVQSVINTNAMLQLQGPYFQHKSWYTTMLRKISSECKHISTFFHHFLPHEECRNKKRVGRCSDGSKIICFDEFAGRMARRAIRENRNCVIYSFGSSDDSCFESSIKNQTDCEIHIFDPTSSELKDPRWTYHSYGLTGSDASFTTFWNWRNQRQAQCNNCPMRNLREIMTELNHTWIDILKIDIDGAEWRSLEYVYNYMKTIPATQIQIELTGLDITDQDNSLARNGTYGVFELWRNLFNDGFRVFHIEPNKGTCIRRGNDRSASFEYALMRTRQPHANSAIEVKFN